MKYVLRASMIVGALMLPAAPALADWVPGDGHKMHWPQLPDPLLGFGVDIVSPNVVADDWQCSRTGPVRDVHVWFSLEYDGLGDPMGVVSQIQWLRLSIHSDVPAEQSPTGYSMPGDLLWEYYPPDVQIPPIPAQAPQGWTSPAWGEWRRPDHHMIFQGNIVDIPEPFIQRQGEIYWLDVSVGFPEGYDGPHVGWSTTSRDLEFNDDAVYLVDDPTGAPPWRELREFGFPDGHSLDMAFVITPEPGTPAMLAGVVLVGLIALGRRRRDSA